MPKIRYTIASTELTEKSDVIQLMLMTIVDLVFGVQMEKNMVRDTSELTEQDCFNLMGEAVDRMTNLLIPEVPPTCQLSKETIRDFVQAFFNTTKGTFAGVLRNPFILKVRSHLKGQLASSKLSRCVPILYSSFEEDTSYNLTGFIKHWVRRDNQRNDTSMSD